MLDESNDTESMLTTIDNPFDPFTQYDEWYAYDVEQARQAERADTCSLLAKIAKSSDELSQADEGLAIEAAIDEIVRLNVLGIYKKVTRTTIDTSDKE